MSKNQEMSRKFCANIWSTGALPSNETGDSAALYFIKSDSSFIGFTFQHLESEMSLYANGSHCKEEFLKILHTELRTIVAISASNIVGYRIVDVDVCMYGTTSGHIENASMARK